jgi:hypothetical protein
MSPLTIIKTALETVRKQIPQTAQVQRQQSAILIKGNPAYTNTPQAKKFYNEILQMVREKNYTVKAVDPKDYTLPPKADLWIGHSRGTERLTYADKQTKTVALGSHGGINHPLDNALRSGVPDMFHFTLTKEMRKAILSKLDENKQTAS